MRLFGLMILFVGLQSGALQASGATRNVAGWAVSNVAIKLPGGNRYCVMKSHYTRHGKRSFTLSFSYGQTGITGILLHAHDGRWAGEGSVRSRIVADGVPRFAGSARYENGILTASLKGSKIRRVIKQARKWAIYVNGGIVGTFPMSGTNKAMQAVEHCVARSRVEQRTAANKTAVTKKWNKARSRILRKLVQDFSLAIGKSDFRYTDDDNGVVGWRYDSGAAGYAGIYFAKESAKAVAAGLVIGVDKCADGVATLPAKTGSFMGGERAYVVTQCRAGALEGAQHIVVVKLDKGLTYSFVYTELLNSGRLEPDGGTDVFDAISVSLTGAIRN